MSGKRGHEPIPQSNVVWFCGSSERLEHVGSNLHADGRWPELHESGKCLQLAPCLCAELDRPLWGEGVGCIDRRDHAHGQWRKRFGFGEQVDE